VRCIALGWLVCAMIAGCSTTPRRVEPPGKPATPAVPSAPTAPTAPTAKSGGYYLDDGPGANPPANLDAVPDAVPRAETLHRGAMRPYTVMGRNYTPMTSLAPYKARGVASWYGRRYHGKQTASGEIYDMYAMTAAHTTLPLPSYVRVTNLANGKSVVVRVNDRGPFIEGYIVDLSRAAAEEINLIKIGVTQVKIELVSTVSNRRAVAETNNSAQLLTQQSSTKPRSSAQYGSDLKPVGVKETADLGKTSNELFSVDMQMMRKTGFGVQVSTLYDSDNVLPTVKKLQQDWPNKVLVSLERDETYNKSTYRIILGPYIDNKTAAVQQKVAAKKGFKGCFIVDLGSM